MTTLDTFLDQVAHFREFGEKTRVERSDNGPPVFLNEFWTAKQRAAHSIHEVSYRACYKPQLPAFFITRLTRPGDLVYDPFLGRGTTMIEAALLDRRSAGNDVNPLSRVLTIPRLRPPSIERIQEAILSADLAPSDPPPDNLDAFFHPDTLAELLGWRAHFQKAGDDPVAAWLQMVAVNRLTGHSTGFFSVYTLPPNQAVTPARQRLINQKRGQTPEYRDTRVILGKKSRSLLRDPLPPGFGGRDFSIFTTSADRTPQLADDSVSLVVTSPPFLNVVNYQTDNWMRNWFINLPPGDIWNTGSHPRWLDMMRAVFQELRRALKPGGIVAFEVGEVRKGSLPLERELIAEAETVGLTPVAILINQQDFTKTAKCWGVDNNAKGTNTNRVLLLVKDAAWADRPRPS